MELWTKRTIKSVFLPGGVIVLGAVLLLDTGWISLSPSGVNFFYYAVFIAAGLLGWRFHSTRVVFLVIVLLLGHHAMEFFAQGQVVSSGPGRIGYEAEAPLSPLDSILMAFSS